MRDELGPTSRRQQTQQLLANALSRQDRQTLALGHAGAEALRVGRALPVLGRKPEEAQDAQVVLADALPGIADEAHTALGEIGIAFERVEHLTVGRAVESVDREVAAARVGRPVGGEGDGGVAAVRLNVLAQRGDLVGHVLGDHGDGAVGDAGRHCSEAGGFDGGDDLLGPGGGGEVDVDHRPAEQRVTHGAADGAGRKSSGGQRAEHGLCRWPEEPFGIAETGRSRRGHGGCDYLRVPGSMRPSFMRGGV